MKTELEYLRLALAQWCNQHRVNATTALSGNEVLAVLTIAEELRAVDKVKIETAAS